MTMPRSVRVGLTLSVGFFWVMGAFLAIVMAIFVLISAGAALLGGVDASMWQNAGSGAFKYFPMAMGIMLTPVLLPLYVAQGVTRRQFTVGGALFVAVWSAGLTLAMVAGFAVEAVAYDALGWPHELENPHLFDSWQQAHLVFAEYFPLIAVHMLAGWIIGMTYYVLGWFRATLLLPVSLLPALAAEVLLATSWIGSALREFTEYTPPSAVVGVTGALLVSAAAWAALYLIVRDMPIKLGAA